MVNNRRSELEIMGDILVLSRDGVKKTELLYQCNLSYVQLKSYLCFLIEKDILEEFVIRDNGNSSRLYRPTEKGLLFLQDVNRVLAHFNI